MEILFNLMWAAVTVALCWMWLADRRRRRGDTLLPATGAQVIAMALLAAILLPAISLTDDLQACTVPAETEHFSRRSDIQASADQPLHPLPLALAVLTGALHFPSWKFALHPLAEDALRSDVRGYSRALTIRPPPPAS